MNTLEKKLPFILVASIPLVIVSVASAKALMVNDVDLTSIDDAVEDDCAFDAHCQEKTWGYHSLCNRYTSRCECYDRSRLNREIVRSTDGTCVIMKRVGDPCSTHKECKIIPGETYCRYGHYYYGTFGKKRRNGSCQCKETSTWYKPTGKCLLKSTKLGDFCEVSEQCRDGTLGRFSSCDIVTGKCICMNFGGALKNTKTIYYEKLKKCFIKKNCNDTCTEDDECRANLGPDATCCPTKYSYEDVCNCPQGKTKSLDDVGTNARPLGKVSGSSEISTVYSLKLFADIFIAASTILAICTAMIFCCYVGIQVIRLHKNDGVIRTGIDTPTVSDRETGTTTVNKFDTSTEAYIATPVVAILKNHNAGSRVSPTAPLLEQQQVLYVHPVQPIQSGCSPFDGSLPQYHRQSFEMSSFPYNPYYDYYTGKNIQPSAPP